MHRGGGGGAGGEGGSDGGDGGGVGGGDGGGVGGGGSGVGGGDGGGDGGGGDGGDGGAQLGYSVAKSSFCAENESYVSCRSNARILTAFSVHSPAAAHAVHDPRSSCSPSLHPQYVAHDRAWVDGSGHPQYIHALWQTSHVFVQRRWTSCARAEPQNISSNDVAEATSQSSCRLKAAAIWNVYFIVVTELVSQTSCELNAAAFANVLPMLVTLLVSQSSGWSKTLA